MPQAIRSGLDGVRPARFRRASSDPLAAYGLGVDPFAIFLSSRSLEIALHKQFIECIARPWLRFHDQAAAFDSKSDFGSRMQPQDIEQRRRYSQHDRAADFTQIGCV